MPKLCSYSSHSKLEEKENHYLSEIIMTAAALDYHNGIATNCPQLSGTAPLMHKGQSCDLQVNLYLTLVSTNGKCVTLSYD